MPFEGTIKRVRGAIEETAAQVDLWFERSPALREFRPAGGGWSIDQILEHITLTNRFLLLTCEKHRRIADHRATRGDAIPAGESDLERMASIGKNGSFQWARPEHMEPTGLLDSTAVRNIMSDQWSECHEILNLLGNGQGALCQVTMTVDNLGKIDLYQWLYFIALHANRHVQQMQRVEGEFTGCADTHIV